MNNKKILAVGATALAVVFAAAACSDTGTDTTVATSPATTSATTTAADEAAAHNAADVMFAQMMLPHHSQAIEMSDMLLAKQDIPADVTALAEQIKAAQGPEIALLESWLEQWGEPTEMPETGHDMPGMDMDEGMGGMEMEGMMSEEDMQALSDAQGTDAARLFLEQMIAHHEGAVDMAQTEIEDGQFPDAVEMARTIVDTQQQEIETMRELLTTL
ncbi:MULTISPECIES: DUF305 domain-containing protein [Mycobacteriales]|jgi:uncharacterized protein (DUF305 family)|uniref:DUF305 domain-containing protein n=2 Tax=Actinomycetes TaxID=1760 RepID=UPI0008305960|nr:MULTISPECIES: DUF305 domain-containing protein [Gordoniaceae]QHN28942.1 DUF305 domain-containing protein [Gordonia pseudamarae]